MNAGFQTAKFGEREKISESNGLRSVNVNDTAEPNIGAGAEQKRLGATTEYMCLFSSQTFFIRKQNSTLGCVQCCGAATFLGGSGSGHPRFRSRLRLQAKKKSPTAPGKNEWHEAAPAPDTNFFYVSSEICNY